MRRRPRTPAAALAVVAVAPALTARAQQTGQQPAQPPSATRTAAGPTGAIRGVIYDSLAGAPLVGAVVQAVQREARAVAYSTTTDSTGAFRLDTLPPGTYLIGFLHPLLDLLDVEVTPRTATVAAGAPTPVALGMPGPRTLRTAVCGASAASANDSTGLLVGMVRDAERDEAVPNATVVLTWNEFVLDQRGARTERRRVPVAVSSVGSYVVCGVPTDGPLVASAQRSGRESGLVEVEIGRSRFLRRDFVLGDSVPAVASATAGGAPAGVSGVDSALPRPAVRRGTARLAGLVRDPNGRPLRGARVQVWGTGVTGTTGEDGRFALDSLPFGTYTVEARAIGFAPRTAPVDLLPRRPATVQLAMDKPATTLGRVTVYGKRSRASRWEDEFLERRKAGWGKFFTYADIDRLHPIYTTDMLRQAAGVSVYPGRAGGSAVRLRGGCTPVVVLDGLALVDGANEIDQLVPPQQLAGIEVYTGFGGIPVQYSGGRANGCGAVLLWTKR